jgi:hypothetical protein
LILAFFLKTHLGMLSEKTPPLCGLWGFELSFT